MRCALLAVIAIGPWVDSPDFPQATQEKALGATLRLHNPQTRGEGTAVRVKRAALGTYYLTAAHCVGNSKNVDLEWFAVGAENKPTRKILAADVLFIWPNEDLALLRAFESEPAPILPIASEKQIPEGKFAVLTVGCGGGKPPELALDDVLAKRKVNKGNGTKASWHWQCAKKPDQGRSGGPLMDKSGHLIGICSGTQLAAQVGYYVHISEIHGVLKDKGYNFLIPDPGKAAEEKTKKTGFSEK